MKHTLVLCVVVSLAVIASPMFAAESEMLTNGSIIEMKSLGLGDDVIIGKIKTSTCNFDTSIANLKQLKDAQVSDAIIQAMLAAAKPVAPAVATPPADPNDPAAPHDPGVYLYQEGGGKKLMTKIEPSTFGQTKSGVPFFAIYGQTEKARAVMTPAHSDLQLHEQPVFYFYFEKTQSGLSDSTKSATNPEDFTLLKMEVRKNHNERRVVIGKVGMSSSSGFDPKQVCEIAHEKVATGIFKVTPKATLADGEYCFLYAGNGGAIVGWGIATGGPGKGFCFGIQTGEKEQSKE